MFDFLEQYKGEGVDCNGTTPEGGAVIISEQGTTGAIVLYFLEDVPSLPLPLHFRSAVGVSVCN